MAAVLISDLVPGDRVSGTVHACAKCGKEFIARSDAMYCSNLCRKAAKREEAKAENEPVHQNH